jgi:hypothetical protein
MVKGGSPRHRLLGLGLRVGDHGFLALVYVRNLTVWELLCITVFSRLPGAPGIRAGVSLPAVPGLT